MDGKKGVFWNVTHTSGRWWILFEITWWSHPFAYTNTFRRKHICSLGSNCFDHQNLCIIHNVLSLFRVILLSATPRGAAMQDDTWSCKTCPLRTTGKCHHILLECLLFSANFHLERVGSASGLLASTVFSLSQNPLEFPLPLLVQSNRPWNNDRFSTWASTSRNVFHTESSIRFLLLLTLCTIESG